MLAKQSDFAFPRAFMSYSWDDEPHKIWVRDLATRLRTHGVDVTLDQWHSVAGDQLPEFMEKAIRGNDFVLIICTPRYKDRSDRRIGGVGYEGDIMTAEVLTTGNQRKFIPILRTGEWQDAAASWLLGKNYIDLKGAPYPEENYKVLSDTLKGKMPQIPPLIIATENKATEGGLSIDTLCNELNTIKTEVPNIVKSLSDWKEGISWNYSRYIFQAKLAECKQELSKSSQQIILDEFYKLKKGKRSLIDYIFPERKLTEDGFLLSGDMEIIAVNSRMRSELKIEKNFVRLAVEHAGINIGAHFYLDKHIIFYLIWYLLIIRKMTQVTSPKSLEISGSFISYPERIHIIASIGDPIQGNGYIDYWTDKFIIQFKRRLEITSQGVLDNVSDWACQILQGIFDDFIYRGEDGRSRVPIIDKAKLRAMMEEMIKRFTDDPVDE